MRLRNRNEEDPATRKLESEGLVKFRSKRRRRINREKIKEFGRISYDFWSGVKYIVVLSAILWWIPLFGPMLAGYVGGRRTGGPKKGLFASIVALFIIGLAYYMLVHGFLSAYFTDISSYMGSQVAVISSHTLIDPYIEFLRYYLSEFFTSITIGIPFGANNYVLTMIFAYIGGIISFEKRKEHTEGVHSLDRVSDNFRRDTKALQRNRPADTTAAQINQKSLKDLKPVKVDGSKKEDFKSKKKSSKATKASFGWGRQDDNLGSTSTSFQDKPLPKAQVEHHSRSNGDDWQLL